MVTYICPECGAEWEGEEGGSLCPVCQTDGELKPPTPPGGIRIRP